MKFQRRILTPHSSTYFEMDEYPSPLISQQSTSINDSTSDLSEIDSVCSLSLSIRQKSDSLTNLFNMSEDNGSLSNLSIGSYSLSQHSFDNTILSAHQASATTNSEKASRLHRSMNSSITGSQKSLAMKTAETVLNNIGAHAPSSSSSSSSDKCGLIANDANDILNIDDNQNKFDNEQIFCESSDENDIDVLTTSTNRRLRKAVKNNVDRFLNPTSKQIKL